jgi:hypothetical protein
MNFSFDEGSIPGGGILVPFIGVIIWEISQKNGKTARELPVLTIYSLWGHTCTSLYVAKTFTC